MSRRRSSARFPLKQRRRDTTDDEQEIIATFSRKRKAESPPEMENTELNKRRQKIHAQWVPISQPAVEPAPSSTLTTTTTTTLPGDTSPALISPHKNNITPQELVVQSSSSSLAPNTPTASTVAEGTNTFRCSHAHLLSPNTIARMRKHSPLPSFKWADSQEVWQLMLKKERMYIREPDMLSRHPTLQPRMRAILLDWLIEVCEVYRLHRETFYLATDFLDRYLSITKGIEKQQLQLLGISSLFIAAKMEEIYPPKLTEFAYVTDGACTENEILDQELVMLKALKWDLAPMTPNGWLNVYLQLVNVESIEDREQQFVVPQYSSHAFIQIARLLDLCTLDVGCLQFPYSILATSAVYHMSSDHIALSVSGYNWVDIAPCVQWMAPYATTLREAGQVELKFFTQVPADATHNIQTHAVDLNLLEKAQTRQSQLANSARSSPELTREYPGLITPPQSTKGKGQGPAIHPPSAPGMARL